MAHCPRVPGVGGQIDFELIKRKTMARLA
jgi:hypothetical protein